MDINDIKDMIHTKQCISDDFRSYISTVRESTYIE